MKADIVVDLQYGDCGKGKVTHSLLKSEEYTHCIRLRTTLPKTEITLMFSDTMAVAMPVTLFSTKEKNSSLTTFQVVFSLESKVLLVQAAL